MEQYLRVLKTILDIGKWKGDPQGVGNLAVAGLQMRFNFQEGFPLVTTRAIPFKAAVGELLWILSGSTDLDQLHKYGVRFWDQWGPPSEAMGHPPGELGPIYGKQWRHFQAGDVAVDQITELIASIRRSPDSRRHIVTAWHPADVNKVFVAPCHCFFQFYHAEGELSLLLYQRSADVPVGVPFNIAEYSLLLMMVAQVTGLRPHEFVHILGDAHIYANQIEGVEEQLTRQPKPLPTVTLDPSVDDIFAFQPEHVILSGYDPHPAIKYPVAL